jgi:hypothetical protein
MRIGRKFPPRPQKTALSALAGTAWATGLSRRRAGRRDKSANLRSIFDESPAPHEIEVTLTDDDSAALSGWSMTRRKKRWDSRTSAFGSP